MASLINYDQPMSQLIQRAKRVYGAAGHSFDGLKNALKYEHAFQEEIIVLLGLIPAGYFLGKNGLEKALLIGVLLLIPIMELVNSALEKALDAITLEPNDLIGIAKDYASMSVTLTIILAAIVWTLIIFG